VDAILNSDVRNNPIITDPKGYSSVPSLKVGPCVADKKAVVGPLGKIASAISEVTENKNEAAVNMRAE